MNDLPGIDVNSGAQRGGGVDQGYRLTDAPWPGEDHELIGDRAGGDVVEDLRAKPKIVCGAVAQQPMVDGPCDRVGSGSRRSPPRVRVRQSSRISSSRTSVILPVQSPKREGFLA
ncbi:hypothetical protein Ate02nite_73590 [Paractinoplanes tereljensis]|uniref:Uncharacterized protein n=1 Tax=Paractinoplanes tereljensis TaxID=571912 RepID=A0A919NVD8_9ACTN|nr:hypothetical protein Ate02nite_73590 [Actinoplanes tereljensis]